jgi:hypothetical protein
MTTVMTPPPDRETFEQEVHRLLSDGDISNIARYLDRDQSAVSKSLNPYCTDRHNPVYEFVRLLWAMDCLHVDLAPAVLTIVHRERDKWLRSGDISDSPARLSGKCGHELAEAFEAEINGLPIDEQINEWTDVLNAVTAKLKSLRNVRQGKARVVDLTVRNLGKELVERHKKAVSR